jgi:1,4-dihydroxy-2-naphthoyl-CoA synthase
MAHKLCMVDELDRVIAETADELLQGAPGAIRTLKLAYAGFAMSPWSAEVATASAKQKLERAPETAEGIASFREKRKPSWYPHQGF